MKKPHKTPSEYYLEALERNEQPFDPIQEEQKILNRLTVLAKMKKDRVESGGS